MEQIPLIGQPAHGKQSKITQFTEDLNGDQTLSEKYQLT